MEKKIVELGFTEIKAVIGGAGVSYSAAMSSHRVPGMDMNSNRIPPGRKHPKR